MIVHSLPMRRAATDAVAALLADARLHLYQGVRPASPDIAAPAGNLLAVLRLPEVPFKPADATGAAMTGEWTGTARAAGMPAWFRMVLRDGTTAFDGDVSLAPALPDAPAGDLVLAAGPVEIGHFIQVTSFRMALP
ncbi:hypothetical protein P7L68_00705 (plasmid) [Tistrella mobilis]|uniref:hypothetical protein n=1 Tax=Tistrella mobilis TaxID=171437 RepID=UPI00355655AC